MGLLKQHIGAILEQEILLVATKRPADQVGWFD